MRDLLTTCPLCYLRLAPYEVCPVCMPLDDEPEAHDDDPTDRYDDPREYDEAITRARPSTKEEDGHAEDAK